MCISLFWGDLYTNLKEWIGTLVESSFLRFLWYWEHMYYLVSTVYRSEEHSVHKQYISIHTEVRGVKLCYTLVLLNPLNLTSLSLTLNQTMKSIKCLTLYKPQPWWWWLQQEEQQHKLLQLLLQLPLKEWERIKLTPKWFIHSRNADGKIFILHCWCSCIHKSGALIRNNSRISKSI